MRTKTDAVMAAAEDQFSDDPERAELIRRARRFKASWLELAASLTRVRRDGHWQAWGYKTFEQYTKKELHLRPDTVEKLTGSYQFLQRRAPSLLEQDALTTSIPSFKAVDLVRRAEESEDAPREAVAEIRRRVLDEGEPVNKVMREYKDVVFPISEDKKKEQDVAAVRNVAKRLRDLLGTTRVVSKGLVADARDVLEKILAEVAPAPANDASEAAAE
jgi:lipopolysaccharide biosynthesis regulator YciM